ncbi:hypothetical protein QZH41_004452 [Actinostola sp. cb2023]|nr:hypothetical protein QZH41_004452 [Actinostola sp. cb2023]
MFGSGTTYPKVIRYECEDGYILQGSRTRQCQSNGKWSEFDPSCEAAMKVFYFVARPPVPAKLTEHGVEPLPDVKVDSAAMKVFFSVARLLVRVKQTEHGVEHSHDAKLLIVVLFLFYEMDRARDLLQYFRMQ